MTTKEKIQLLIDRGWILHDGSFFEMPYDNLYDIPEDEDKTISYLVFWKGFGFGIKGVKGFV